MNDATVNDPVKKPTGPKPRPPISSKRDSNDPRSGTIFMKNSSRESINSSSSLEKPGRNAMARSKSKSLFVSEDGRNLGPHHNTSGTKLYPNLESMRKELSTQGKSSESSSTSDNSPPRSVLDSSNTVSSDERPKKPAHVEQPEKPKIQPRTDDRNQNDSSLWTWAVKVIVIVFVACVVFNHIKPEGQSDVKIKNYSPAKLRKEVDDLKKHFPSQDKWIWKFFFSGIDGVASDKANRVKPAVFLLLAMNDKTTDCLVEKVAEIVSSNLGGTGYAALTTKDMGNSTDDAFQVVEKKYQETKLVVFQDVLNMEPGAVSALHYICDPDYKLIEKVVYMIIMKSALYEDTEKPILYAERQLRKTFSNSLTKELEALITRVTAGAVLPIKEEKIIPCSK